MKSAPLIAGGAFLVLLGTLATAKAPNPPEIRQALDFRGITTLEARSNRGVSILVSTEAPVATYQDRIGSAVRVRRDGERLIVIGNLDGYDSLSLRVPPTLTRFVVQDGTVRTRVPMHGVEVLSHGSFTWKGDVESLLLQDAGVPVAKRNEVAAAAVVVDDEGNDTDCDCDDMARLDVEGGRIGLLRVHSRKAALSLDDPDSIGVAYAWLGPDGHVTINHARRYQQIHLMAEDAPAPP